MRTVAKKRQDIREVTNDFSRNRAYIPVPSIVSSNWATNPAIQLKSSCPCDGGCPRCAPPIQPKLKIGQPNDKYEQEADRVAEQVMRIPEPVKGDRKHQISRNLESLKTSPLIQSNCGISKTTGEYIACQSDEGESWFADISNLGVGTINNQTKRRFCGSASAGKSGALTPVVIPPGQWGGKNPINGLNDIDFIYPTKNNPINGYTDGAFKIGSNDASLKPDPDSKTNTLIDDWSSYLPAKEARNLPGIPTQPPGTRPGTGNQPTIQRKTTIGGSRAQGNSGGTHLPPQGKGRGIPSPERTFFEMRFGRDFGDVRLHMDAGAAESAGALNARAYTIGKNIVFGAGQYSPGTADGRMLLAHELTHTLQQNFRSSSTDENDTILRKSQSTPFEIEEWDDVERDFSVHAVTVLVREQITQNQRIKKWFDDELSKRGQNTEDLLSGVIPIPVIIMDKSGFWKGRGQTRWNGVFTALWTGKRYGRIVAQPDKSIALADSIFTDDVFDSRSQDMMEAATTFIHELTHWVDAYADGVQTKAPKGYYDFGDYMESLVNNSIYDKILKQKRDLVKMK